MLSNVVSGILFMVFTFGIFSGDVKAEEQTSSEDQNQVEFVDQRNFTVRNAKSSKRLARSSNGAGSSGDNVLKDTTDAEPLTCPHFSSSPYSDIFAALDSLQYAIGDFSDCSDSKKTTDSLSGLVENLKKQIEETKGLQENGETREFGLSAEKILALSSQLQDFMTRVTLDQKSNCYQSERGKQLIFSINDTFQSLAPLALDLAAKNPTLAPVLSKYLPVVAGAAAISKGISVLEMALSYQPTLDLTDKKKAPEIRAAMLKNTCSFMKVYSKVELLTLDRASRLQKINQEFESKIKASHEVKRNLMAALSFNPTMFTNNKTDQELLLLRQKSERNKKSLSLAISELRKNESNTSESSDSVSGSLNDCSLVRSVIAKDISREIVSDLEKTSMLLNKTDQVEFKLAKIKVLNAAIGKITDGKVSSCASEGRQWLEALQDALEETRSLLLDYQNTNDEFSSQEEKMTLLKINEEEKKALNLEDEKKKLAIFVDLSNYEPSELAKRMRILPRYLFNGPDGGPWYNKILKRRYGPVFDLLYDNELSFQDEMKSFKSHVKALQNFEYKMISGFNLVQMDRFMEKTHYFQEKDNFAYLTPEFLSVGSIDHAENCGHAILAIMSYDRAISHLAHSEDICKMIAPVLKEESVSPALKKYCLDTRPNLSEKIVRAGYKNLARDLFVKNGPMSQVEKIYQKFSTLKCN